MDDKFLKPLQNPIKNKYPIESKHRIFGENIWGINPKKVQTKQQELNQFNYDIALPVDVVLTPIDDLAYMAHYERRPWQKKSKLGWLVSFDRIQANSKAIFESME